MILLILSLGCTGGRRGGGQTPPTSRTSMATGTLWDFVPRGAAAILITDFDLIPASTRRACAGLCTVTPPVRVPGAAREGVTAWYEKETLNAYGFEKLPAPSADAPRHRDVPVAGDQVHGTAYLGNRHLIWGSAFRVRLSVDLRKGVEVAGARATREFTRMVTALGSGGVSPALLLVTRDRAPFTKLLKALGGASTPLRGGLVVRFPARWATVMGILEFATVGAAEAFVGALRARLVAALSRPGAARFPWVSILTPLSVHPEGRKVYIQWAARRATFDDALASTRHLLELMRRKLATPWR